MAGEKGPHRKVDFRETLPRGAVAVEVHNYHPKAHDGGAAVYIPATRSIVAVGAERVNRTKHSPNSAAAYSFLREQMGEQGHVFGTGADKAEVTFDRHQPIHHHLSHAASGYYPSGFENAGVLVMDDRGYYQDGYNSTTIWHGKGTELTPLAMNKEVGWPSQSIGHLYSGFSDYLGFGFLEAGKTMGLAAYGKTSKVREWLGTQVEIDPDGSYHIDPNLSQAMRFLYSDHDKGKALEPTEPVREKMTEVLQVLGPRREKDEKLTLDHADAAWAVQDVLEDMVLGLAKKTKTLTGSDKLCLAGGVALNSVANGKVVKSGLFSEVFIQPAAGDDGQALGKLLYRLHNEYGVDRLPPMTNAYLGPEYSQENIDAALAKYSKDITVERKDEETLLRDTAQALSEHKVIGWFQGGSEIGPRALGHRSILADPRPGDMKDHVNFEVKHREWFRPLAPSVPLEDAPDYFDAQGPNPFMLVVADVKPDKRDVIPAVTHVDGTARIQTVTEKDNGIYYRLIKEFGRQTGVPVVLNTSFNVAGEPIVETPDDAIRSFLSTNLDMLVIHDHVIRKKVKQG